MMVDGIKIKHSDLTEEQRRFLTVIRDKGTVVLTRPGDTFDLLQQIIQRGWYTTRERKWLNKYKGHMAVGTSYDPEK